MNRIMTQLPMVCAIALGMSGDGDAGPSRTTIMAFVEKHCV